MQTVILKGEKGKDDIQLQCKDKTVITTNNNSTIIDYKELLYRLREHGKSNSSITPDLI